MTGFNKFVIGVAIFILGYMSALYIHNDTIDDPFADQLMNHLSMFNNENTQLNWQNLLAFLQETKSEFLVEMDAQTREENIEINVTSRESGSLWVYGINQEVDKIVPLCIDNQSVQAQIPAKYLCDLSKLDRRGKETLIFAFVTVSKSDEQKIRRFIQLRSNLLPGETFKGLNFTQQGDLPAVLESEERTGLGIDWKFLKS